MGKRQFRGGRAAPQAEYPTSASWRRTGLAAGAGALLALGAAACDMFVETTGGVAVAPSEDAGLDAGLPDAAVPDTTGGVAPEPDGGE